MADWPPRWPGTALAARPCTAAARSRRPRDRSDDRARRPHPRAAPPTGSAQRARAPPGRAPSWPDLEDDLGYAGHQRGRELGGRPGLPAASLGTGQPLDVEHAAAAVTELGFAFVPHREVRRLGRLRESDRGELPGEQA